MAATCARAQVVTPSKGPGFFTSSKGPGFFVFVQERTAKRLGGVGVGWLLLGGVDARGGGQHGEGGGGKFEDDELHGYVCY